jgi:hypothetical protein
MQSSDTPARQRLRTRTWLAPLLLVMLLLLAIGLRHVLQPQVASRLLLDQVGRTLGLQITATGQAQYSVRGTPLLVIRDVVARQPGAAEPLLRADRILVSMPWSGIRALRSSTADTIDMARVELDHPQLRLDALQRWLASRPPGKTRYPVLTHGLQVRDGRIDAAGWTLDGIGADFPALVPHERVAGHVAGRYRTTGLSMPFALELVLAQLASDTALGMAGPVSIAKDDWRIDSRIVLSTRLRVADGWQLDRMRLAAASKYQSGATRLPFTAGVAGALRYHAQTFLFAPLAVVVHGTSPVPDVTARGDAALARSLVLRLSGSLPTWPEGWPALPPPIDAADAPLAFALQYRGATDLSAPMSLQLRKQRATFDGRLHPLEVGGWIRQASNGNPIPPLTGHASMPELDVAGARLQGVDISIEADSDHAP